MKWAQKMKSLIKHSPLLLDSVYQWLSRMLVTMKNKLITKISDNKYKLEIFFCLPDQIQESDQLIIDDPPPSPLMHDRD